LALGGGRVPSFGAKVREKTGIGLGAEEGGGPRLVPVAGNGEEVVGFRQNGLQVFFRGKRVANHSSGGEG